MTVLDAQSVSLNSKAKCTADHRSSNFKIIKIFILPFFQYSFPSVAHES